MIGFKLNFANANILDLYSGVGSFGIESVSQEMLIKLFYRERPKGIFYIKRKYI